MQDLPILRPQCGDPGKAYRPEEEIEEWKSKRDPLKIWRISYLRTGCGLEEIRSIDEAIQRKWTRR